MLAHPRVIRRALPGEIERDLEPQTLGLVTKRVELVERAQSGLDRGVSALRRSNRPGTARIGRRGGQRVVAALAETAADRMNRRQIDDVESQVGDAGQRSARLAERRAAGRIGAGRSREHFVPRAEARALAVHPDAARRRVRRPRSIRIREHPRCEPVVDGRIQALVDRRRVAQRVGTFEQPVRIGCRPEPFGAARRLAHEQRPFEQFERDVLVRRSLRLDIAAPGLEAIDPGHDLVLVPAGVGGVERRRPLVAARGHQEHRRFAPACVLRGTRDSGFGVLRVAESRFPIPRIPVRGHRVARPPRRRGRRRRCPR